MYKSDFDVFNSLVTTIFIINYIYAGSDGSVEVERNIGYFCDK